MNARLPTGMEIAEAHRRRRDAADDLFNATEYAAVTLREMAAILRGNGLPGCAGICEAAVTKCELAIAKARGEQ